MMIARDADYNDVLNAVKGCNVVVFTCNTCARLCNNIGGSEAAARLSYKLKEDGVTVSSPISVSAACLMSKVRPKIRDIPDDTEKIIALTCDTGAICIEIASQKNVLAPLVTLGSGFVDEDGSLIITSSPDMRMPVTLENAAKEKGMMTDPFV